MATLLRFLFYGVFIRVLVWIVLGINVRHRERLPRQGPAVIVANHNSHLDTMVLMTLFPLRLLPKLHPVAAMDYFLRSKIFAWFTLQVVGILPIKRTVQRGDDNPLAPCNHALAAGKLLIIFPEGSRGEPEQLQSFKGGIARLAEANPRVPIVPVFLHGLGKALPKGEAILVPFFCDVFVGEPLLWNSDRRGFMHQLDERMKQLAGEGNFPSWE
ncbi:MAG: 1-acyl-sn-glycerol-3-phosphate acyltransferase [Deltaproteobacteria bacterium]|nr:1-acyl-sn-glycerol-3-phosphate acyltransferase [Deltaproteobacteria bacterium]